MFDRELIENRALTEHACAMHEPYPEIIGEGEGSISVRTGAVVRQDGSVAFRVYAPEAKEAYVTLTSFADVKVELEKDESGVFFGVLPYEERLRGPQDVKFWLDGTMYLHPRMPAQEADAASISRLAQVISRFTLRVEGTRGLDSAQVTAGGIAPAEFDPAAMESRLVPGLYAAGEVLDVDGGCGGHNLMFAFASGLLAGQH